MSRWIAIPTTLIFTAAALLMPLAQTLQAQETETASSGDCKSCPNAVAVLTLGAPDQIGLDFLACQSKTECCDSKACCDSAECNAQCDEPQDCPAGACACKFARNQEIPFLSSLQTNQLFTNVGLEDCDCCPGCQSCPQATEDCPAMKTTAQGPNCVDWHASILASAHTAAPMMNNAMAEIMELRLENQRLRMELTMVQERMEMQMEIAALRQQNQILRTELSRVAQLPMPLPASPTQPPQVYFSPHHAHQPQVLPPQFLPQHPQPYRQTAAISASAYEPVVPPTQNFDQPSTGQCTRTQCQDDACQDANCKDANCSDTNCDDSECQQPCCPKQTELPAASEQRLTIRLPKLSSTTTNTTVSVPDGGKVLIGGRARASQPLPPKGPQGSIQLRVTPKLEIQEEEEQLLILPKLPKNTAKPAGSEK